MKKYLSILVFLFLILTLLGVVTAASTNASEVIDNQQDIEENNGTDNALNVKYGTVKSSNEKETITEDSQELDEGCCTTIVQGDNNDSATSFRRDGYSKATINVKYNDTILKQYKTDGSYFFHIMISKDGWVVGTGGLEGTTTCRNIESYSLSMINNNNMSSYYLNKIFSIKAGSSLSHYVIKSPNGTFNLQIKRDGRILRDSGVLKPGQYVVVPNKVPLYQRGTLSSYKDTESNMLNYSRYLSSHDKYGVQRRQILTYYYKNNIVNSSIKVIVANDNGRHVGVRSAQYVDNIQTNTRFIPSSSIPVLDNSLNVDKANFFIRKTKTSIKTMNITSNKGKITLSANVRDEFGRNVNTGKVSVVVDGKTLKYSDGNVMYVQVRNGQVKYNTTLKNLWNSKKHSYYMKYESNSLYGDSVSGNSQISIDDFFTIKTTHYANIFYGSKLAIKTTVSYDENYTWVTGGRVFYKINGKTVLNSKNKTLFKAVKGGKAVYNFTFNSKYKARTYVLTTVYVNGAYRREYKTNVTVKKIPAKIVSHNIRVRGKTVSFTGKLVDRYNKTFKYDSFLTLKINGKHVKTSNVIKKYGIKQGKVNFKFTLPDNHVKRNIISVTIPESREALSFTKNYTLRV